MGWSQSAKFDTATTSLKLPDDLKKTIAQVAAFEGKTAHALMVDTQQAAMEDKLVRQQFYADGEAAYQGALRSNAVYAGADVKAYVMARVRGGTPVRPQANPLDTTRAANPSAD
jgi:predicted transcriptional regulator